MNKASFLAKKKMLKRKLSRGGTLSNSPSKSETPSKFVYNGTALDSSRTTDGGNAEKTNEVSLTNSSDEGDLERTSATHFRKRSRNHDDFVLKQASTLKLEDLYLEEKKEGENEGQQGGNVNIPNNVKQLASTSATTYTGGGKVNGQKRSDTHKKTRTGITNSKSLTVNSLSNNKKRREEVTEEELLMKRIFWIKPLRTIACLSLFDTTMALLVIDIVSVASAFLWFDHTFAGGWGFFRAIMSIASSSVSLYVSSYIFFTKNRTELKVYRAVQITKAFCSVAVVLGLFIATEELANGRRCERYESAGVSACLLSYLALVMLLVCDAAIQFFVFFIAHSISEWIRSGRQDLILTNLVSVSITTDRQNTLVDSTP